MAALVGGKGWILGVAAAIALVASGGVAAALSGADAVKDRQAHMKAMGAAAKALFEQVKADTPDAAIIKTSAAKIDESAQGLPHWFPAGSGPEAGVKTGALPVIWTDQAGFAAAAHSLAVEAAKLNGLAQAGDIAGVKGQAMVVGGACAGCHKKFRKKED